MTAIYTVSELTGRIKSTIEGELPFVWVRGQVTNLSRPGSGHIYFTLKDADAALSVVWFKSQQRAGLDGPDPLTGEVYEDAAGPVLEDGKELLCGGRITVYPPRGVYQMVAELVQEQGMGELHLEFEELKRKFQAMGYFDQDRKRPLPPHPERVAVVTAPGGAAIRDFLRLAEDRGMGAEIRVYPTLVQGDEAPEQIARALGLVNEQGWAQVVVLIRGGGSLEDLWAFNTEPVAGAVYDSTVPVLCGVGHEKDVSLADMIADVRAATPSHAAQLLWPERRILAQRMDELDVRLGRAWERYFSMRERELAALERGLAWLSPASRLNRMAEQVENHAARLEQNGLFRFRGLEQALDQSGERLDRAVRQCLEGAERGLEYQALRLAGLDPEAPLDRGYSLVRLKESGRFLRSVEEAGPGDELEIRVRDGGLGARVTEVTPDEPDPEKEGSDRK